MRQNYRFHNPNEDGSMEKYILQMLAEQAAEQMMEAVKSSGNGDEETGEEF